MENLPPGKHLEALKWWLFDVSVLLPDSGGKRGYQEIARRNLQRICVCQVHRQGANESRVIQGIPGYLSDPLLLTTVIPCDCVETG